MPTPPEKTQIKAQQQEAPANNESASKEPASSEPKTPQQNDEITATFINGDTVFKQSKVNQNNPVPYPGDPQLQAGQVGFIGWFTEPVGGTQFNFKAPLQYSTTFYAHFNQSYLIQYKNQQGTVMDSKEVAPGNLIPKSTVELTPPAGEHFYYWYVEGDLTETPFNFDATKVSKNLVLVPKFSAQRTVLFVSEGSQVNPEYINSSNPAPKPADPVRDGYTFSHWSTEINGANGYDFNSPITNDLTLYAVWTPKKVSYTIAYWMEAPNLSSDPGNDTSKYNFAWSTVKEDGQAGEDLTLDQTMADNIKNSDSQASAALKYSEYSFSDSHTISGNGQTIINVYYKRTIYQVKFNLVRSDAEMEANGAHYTGSSSNLYTISAKYGQSIQSLWPNNPKVQDSGYYFHGWKYPYDSPTPNNATTGAPLTLTSTLISTASGKHDLTLTADYISSSIENVRKIYVESFNTTGEKFEDKYYDLLDTQNYYSSSGSYVEDSFYGLTFYARHVNDPYSGSYYYLRNKHTLTYNTQGGSFQGDGQSTTKKYEEKISAPKDPIRAGYTFTGWYLDSDYRQKVDFNTFVIPDSDVVFFAKWDSNQNTVHYYDSLGGNQLLQQGYADNNHVVFPSDYVKGKTYVDGKGLFNGWFWQVGQSSFEFSDTIPITHDIDLYAKWQTDNFHVTYNLGEGTGTTPADGEKYDLTTKALIKDDNNITPPNGRVFIGWQSDKENTIYYPNDHMQVRGDTNLTALYASTEDVVHINYHAGEYTGSPESISQNAVKNSNVALKGALFERPGKTLTGWSKTANGSKDYDLSENNVAVGNSDLNLYAVWENATVNITFLPGDNGTLNYDSRSTMTSVDYGQTWKEASINVPKPKPDSKYKFAGWSPVLPSEDEKLTKDYIFTAQFVKRAKATVTVRYVDENGEKISDDKPLKGLEGEPYDVSGSTYKLEKIGDYTLKKVPTNIKGTFNNSNILVVFTYSKAVPKGSGKVLVKYIDDKGNKLHPDLELNGTIGTLYDIKGSNIMIDGYHFVKTNGKVNGRFNKEPLYITHVYKKNSAAKKISTKNGKTPKKTIHLNKKGSSINTRKTNTTVQKRHSNQYPKTGENKGTSLLLTVIGFVLVIGTFSIVQLRKKHHD
ncbi:InlB B-repeat-containing protein [Enterococcus malodoratus]|uniref:InlB B-repeat-containing protein n=1 Tax=Enterococcus malodoratus TaxID=71451 RepID=UPI003FD13DED